jgi:hypothetical protein
VNVSPQGDTPTMHHRTTIKSCRHICKHKFAPDSWVARDFTTRLRRVSRRSEEGLQKVLGRSLKGLRMVSRRFSDPRKGLLPCLQNVSPSSSRSAGPQNVPRTSAEGFWKVPRWSSEGLPKVLGSCGKSSAGFKVSPEVLQILR